MIEKCLLVVLIVAGTSLIFMVCFPIDFYLYRRRKRRLRERLIVHDTDLYKSNHTELFADTEPVTDEKTFEQIIKCCGLGKDENHIIQPSKLKLDDKGSNQSTFCTNTKSFSSNDSNDINSPAETDPSTVDTALDKTEHQPEFESNQFKISEPITLMGPPNSDLAVRENKELWGPDCQDVTNGQSNILNGLHVMDESLKHEGILFFVVNDGHLKGEADLSSLCSMRSFISEKSCNLNTDRDRKSLKEKYFRDSNMITVRSGYITDQLKENHLLSGNLLHRESSCGYDNSEDCSQEIDIKHGIDTAGENAHMTISSVHGQPRTTFLDRCKSTRVQAVIWPRAWSPADAVDEFTDSRSTASLKVAAGSFDEESVISTRRKKKIKKDGQKVSTTSNLSTKKKKFITKQDYYTNSKALPALYSESNFSRY